MFTGTGAWLQRVFIIHLYIPTRGLIHRVRDSLREVRARLGLRERPVGVDEWRLPKVSWRSICQPKGIQFLEVHSTDGNVSKMELAVLNALCRTYEPKQIFEIGTFDGRTTLNLAFNSEATVTTLDLPAQSLEDSAVVGADRRYVEKPYSGARFVDPPHNELPCVQRIEQQLGDSTRFDFGPWKGRMDLVFIDGAHTYDFVVNDSAVALDLVNRDGGIIVWHDYGQWPDVAIALRELAERHPDLPLVHVEGTTLAISIAGRPRT